MTDDDYFPESVELPIDGTLDLHQFRPNEVKDLLYDYLPLCQEHGILQVRIIHGKGTGTLRAAVHQALKRNKFVKKFRLGMYGEGEDGVTIAEFV